MIKPEKSPLRFRIRGMDCAEEVAVLRRELAPVVGGEDKVAFDLLNGEMIVTPHPGQIPVEHVVKAVARTGMRAELVGRESAPGAEEHGWRWRLRTILAAASGLLTLIGLLVHARALGGVVEVFGAEGIGLRHSIPGTAQVLYGLGIISGGWYVLPRAWLAAKRLRPDMNLLMTVAVLGAISIGEWLEAATVSFLFSLSLALESWSIGRARRAIAALVRLAPLTARVKRGDGSEVEVPAEDVAVGATLVVKPGERVPLDGRVVRGNSEVDQAPITGESLPVSKGPGDGVFAGTVNGNGALEVECSKAAQETTLAHIIRLVAEAQLKRAASEQWVDRFAAIYTPFIMGLSVTILLVPPLVFGQAWGDWVYRSLVLLVIGCPCALVISTPVSMVAALARAAQAGVIIKGGRYIEAIARLKALAFDKTGTLTEGRPTVVSVVPLGRHQETEVLKCAAAVETRSGHPLAGAIVAFAGELGVVVEPARDFQMIQGKGATAALDGQRYWLGSHRYLEERGQETEEVHRTLEAMSQAGRSVVVLGNEFHVCGLIAVADSVRAQARHVVAGLRAVGVRHIAMLTGDNEGTAKVVGRDAGIEDVRAELLPDGKVEAIEAMVARYGSVAMVGDGVNDAPAMARATVGIAMAAAGSDAAIETSDVALMSDDLSKLPWLISHAQRTLRVIKQNIGFSLSVKAAFVILTFAGWATLWGAIAADMGASLLVIFNGLTLLGSPRHS